MRDGRSWRLPGLGLALLLVLVSAGSAGGEEPPSDVVRGRADSSRVALLEWQWPTAEDARLPTPPAQAALLEKLGGEPASLAFAPRLSDENAGDSERTLEKLTRHAARVHEAFRAGREQAPLPWLLNISKETPRALEVVIASGVRLVSISSASQSSLSGLDEVVKAHPEVLFVCATPHISGNSIPVEQLGERPSVLATLGHGNVLLVGCLEFYEEDRELDARGTPLGSAANPYTVTSQPAGDKARQVFLLSCRESGCLPEGLGTTSGAAPFVTALLAVLLTQEGEAGRPTTLASVLESLVALTARAHAREKSGEVREVNYLTAETVRATLGSPPRDQPPP